MKILVCHNFYQQPGGEDRVYDAETRLLEEHGHEVVRYEARNAVIGAVRGVGLAASTIWSQRTYRAIRRLIRAERPALMHVHNTLPLISPSAYYAAHAEDVPVVQTLHNYRLTCANAQLFRDGHPCEECVGRAPWPAIAHACYRGSRAATAAVAAMLVTHRAAGTWTRAVDAYIALTEFARRKLIAGGLPADRVHVKGNFVSPDPGIGDGRSGDAVFVGRLTAEKGIHTLLDAWRRIGSDVRLTIVGDGPLAPAVRLAALVNPNIRWLGHRSRTEVLDILGRASCLVFPSELYEAFPVTLAEAFSRGTPVIAARIGAAEEIIEDGRTGILYTPGDAESLAHSISTVVCDQPRLDAMRIAARAVFERRMTAHSNYRSLMEVYASVLGAQPSVEPGEAAVASRMSVAVGRKAG